MSDKCFCHLNGYKVKDADAHADIEVLKGLENANRSNIAILQKDVTTANSTLNGTVKQVDNINKNVNGLNETVLQHGVELETLKQSNSGGKEALFYRERKFDDGTEGFYAYELREMYQKVVEGHAVYIGPDQFSLITEIANNSDDITNNRTIVLEKGVNTAGFVERYSVSGQSSDDSIILPTYHLVGEKNLKPFYCKPIGENDECIPIFSVRDLKEMFDKFVAGHEVFISTLFNTDDVFWVKISEVSRDANNLCIIKTGITNEGISYVLVFDYDMSYGEITATIERIIDNLDIPSMMEGTLFFITVTDEETYVEYPYGSEHIFLIARQVNSPGENFEFVGRLIGNETYVDDELGLNITNSSEGLIAYATDVPSVSLVFMLVTPRGE